MIVPLLIISATPITFLFEGMPLFLVGQFLSAFSVYFIPAMTLKLMLLVLMIKPWFRFG